MFRQLRTSVKYGVGGGLFFSIYIGLASHIIDVKSNNKSDHSYAMVSPLVAVQLIDYSAHENNSAESYWGSQTNPYQSTPRDETGYFQDQWRSTDPNSGFGYWSNGQWILTEPSGEGYWRNGQWVRTSPGPSRGGYWEFGTWVDTPEHNHSKEQIDSVNEQDAEESRRLEQQKQEN